MDPESIHSVFALFDCFGAILYESLIAWLMDSVYQLDTYEVLPEALVNMGKRAFISGEQRERPNFHGNKDNIWEQLT